jgi:hypothetical protein
MVAETCCDLRAPGYWGQRAASGYLALLPWESASENKVLGQLRDSTPSHLLDIVDRVWERRELFIRWPSRPLLFMPGTKRNSRYHQYTADQKRQLRQAEITPDGRSNGPAIMAYLLAGGERPHRVSHRKQWSVHHIYDGKFPAPGRDGTTHAVKDGRFFTEASGLVAIHPIGDTLADEVPYFAWLLRREAFCRFEFDPDGVFSLKV